MSAPLACPLPWKRALQQKLAFRRDERWLVIDWLRSHGWRPDLARPGHWPGYLAWWVDCAPAGLFLPSVPLASAVRAQALRDAQRVLEPRGWTLESGLIDARGRWCEVSELRKRGLSRSVRLGQALDIEGIGAPPALWRVEARPRLVVLRGGRAETRHGQTLEPRAQAPADPQAGPPGGAA